MVTMETLSHNDPSRMYSWWWDSHICPKNSKWLQENLTDMDAHVKAMIKVIELDGDSFKRRAEMYYRKRPELRRIVEEFYRAYRALAERYDHVTGSLRQAHRTIAQAFPDKVPMLLNDDLCTTNTEPCTPEMDLALFDPDELQKTISGVSLSDSQSMKCNSAFSEYSDSETSREELKPMNDLFGCVEAAQNHSRFSEGRESKSLDFQKARDGKVEDEIRTLRDNLTKLEAEKKFNLARYEQCLERLSNIESNQDLSRLESEKEVLLGQLEESLKVTSNLENKFLLADMEASKLSKRTDNAEREIENLKHALAISTEERDGAVLNFENNIQKISDLEHEISQGVEEAKKLNAERESKNTMLKDAEERSYMFERSNQSLHVELGSLNQKLMEKQEEVGRLWTCLQEERFQIIEVEAAFQRLEHQHSCSQEELRSLKAELHNGAQIIKELECSNQELHGEMHLAKEENVSLKELNISSYVTIANMEDEISRLRAIELQLREEISLRVDQRNALQQEIYCLKEEINDSNKNIASLIEQIISAGLNPESFGASVKELQEEGLKLKEICQMRNIENTNLLEKLRNMENNLEKNIVLENSLSDAGVELEEFRGKAKALEVYCQSLVGEKMVLADEKRAVKFQLQVMSQSFENLLKKYNIMENSLSDSHVELEDAKTCIYRIQDENQKLVIENQKVDSLSSDLELERNAVKLWENEAAALFGELQASSFRVTLFEEKIHEFMKECEGFEDQKSSKDLELYHLNERIRSLEAENGNLKSQLASHIGVLKDSLESHTKGRTHSDAEKYQKVQTRDHGFSEDLRELETRIMGAVEKNRITEQDLVKSNAKLEAAMIQIEEFLQPLHDQNCELITKDITLDQISKYSSRKISSRREDFQTPPLEIWETDDQTNSIELTANKGKKALLGEEKTCQTSDFISESLDSDAQKLKSLGITVRELKKKVEICGKSRKVKGIDIATVKLQLKEAEEAVLEFVDFNEQLRRNARNGKTRIERCLEQSEKILGLESEVEKMKSGLMNDEKDRKARIRFYDHKTRVVLQDYLHGSSSSKTKSKNKNVKKSYCSCVQPSTKSD